MRPKDYNNKPNKIKYLKMAYYGKMLTVFNMISELIEIMAIVIITIAHTANNTLKTIFRQNQPN